MIFDKIDWNEEWKYFFNAKKETVNVISKQETWDKRAKRFNESIKDGWNNLSDKDYISQILKKVDVDHNDTVLDIGSGPGTLAIPLAKKVKHLTALDVSEEMLNFLKENALTEGLNNIKYINKAWEDIDIKKDLEKHDVVIASRSLIPYDLRKELTKIDKIAKKSVYLVYPTKYGHSYDKKICEFLDKDYNLIKSTNFPGFIYVYNLLYQMEIDANVEFLNCKRTAYYKDINDAISDFEWRIGQFTQDEKERVISFLNDELIEKNGIFRFKKESKTKWVMIWWKKGE